MSLLEIKSAIPFHEFVVVFFRCAWNYSIFFLIVNIKALFLDLLNTWLHQKYVPHILTKAKSIWPIIRMSEMKQWKDEGTWYKLNTYVKAMWYKY